MDQIIFGVLGNAAYDVLSRPVKAAWERFTHKSVESLYIEAFAYTVKEVKPFFQSHEPKTDVEIDTDALRKVLHQDLAVNLDRLPLSDVQDEVFIQRLAQAMAEQHVLIVTNGSLDQDGYAQLVRNLIRHANNVFREAILGNEAAFRQVLIEEAQKQGIQVEELQQYLATQFGILLRRLDTIDGRLVEQGTFLYQSLLNSYQAEKTAREKAERELHRLQSRKPLLAFGLFKGDVNLSQTLEVTPTTPSVEWQSDESIEQVVAERKAKIDEFIKDARNRLAAPRQTVGFSDFAFNRRREPTLQEITDYEKQCKTSIQAYRTRLIMYRSRVAGRRCPLDLTLFNGGSVSATDIEVILFFPEGTYLVSVENEGEEYIDVVKPPYSGIPEAPWERDPMSFISPRVVPHFPGPVGKPTYPEGPIIGEWEREYAIYTHPNLRPKEFWDLDPIVCYLPPSILDSFQVEYEIKSNDLPEPARGTLTIILT